MGRVSGSPVREPVDELFVSAGCAAGEEDWALEKRGRQHPDEGVLRGTSC
jgi:hypothetical protein